MKHLPISTVCEDGDASTGDRLADASTGDGAVDMWAGSATRFASDIEVVDLLLVACPGGICVVFVSNKWIVSNQKQKFKMHDNLWNYKIT